MWHPGPELAFSYKQAVSLAFSPSVQLLPHSHLFCVHCVLSKIARVYGTVHRLVCGDFEGTFGKY